MSQKTKNLKKIKEIEFKVKPSKHGKCTENLDTVGYCVVFDGFLAEERTVAKRHLIINAAGLIQHIYFENALTSKFRSKDTLLWRRGFAFVSTGNQWLWIHSGLRKIRFDQGRPPEKSPIGTDGPDDSTFQSTSVRVSSESYIQNNLKTAN